MKKTIAFFAAILLYNTFIFSQEKYHAALLNMPGSERQAKELQAALTFITDKKEFQVDFLPLKITSLTENTLKSYDFIWIHQPDSTSFTSSETDPAILESLLTYINGGGHLLLTLDAVKYLNYLNLETEPIQTRYANLSDEGYGRKAGLHSFRSHPFFDGLYGGAYIYFPLKDEMARQCGFFDQAIPADGQVVAVDWSYIFLREDTKLVFDYTQGKGEVIAIGAYTYFAAGNRCRRQLEAFMSNVFRYMVQDIPGSKIEYWNYDKPEILPFTYNSAPVAIPRSSEWPENHESLTIKGTQATNNFWDVATQRILVMGKETGGISEIWSHPFMAMRDFEAGIKFSTTDTVIWLNNEHPEVIITPESFTRKYTFAAGQLKEVITADISKPVCIVHYEFNGSVQAQVITRFRSNFRFMWPYSEKALGSLYYTWDEGLNAFVLRDGSGDFTCVAGSTIAPRQKYIGQYDDWTLSGSGYTGIPTGDFLVSGLSVYDVQKKNQFDIVISASDEGTDKTMAYYLNAISNPADVFASTTRYTRDVLNNNLMVTSPDPEFNEGYRWAVIGTDRFFVNTPGIGGSLVAGYATTQSGWDGGHKVNGRPGYGWYFGRDGVWSGMALLDYGDFEKVKSMLEVYRKFQDIDGKIYHELTTSGVAHYDAADATPLFIILAGKYLRHTGDLAFIAESWPDIKKAIDFCFSTDTDGDHLIENTNVGHGWVEGGALYGTHSTLYLVSCWAAALEEAAYMAEHLDVRQMKTEWTSDAKKYREEADMVKKIINTDFWNPDKGYFYDGKYADGRYLDVPTIQNAIPLYFKQADRDKAVPVLENFAGHQFTSDWGARIIREDSPIFNANGYHEGSVWPLFTGWAALAEYKNGYYVQGFSHIMNNLLIYKNWARGFIEEVLNGNVYKPSGVCPHQCWSETMVIQPVIEGMLGLEPSAPDNCLSLAPCFPVSWDSVEIDNICIGNQKITMKMKRLDNRYTYTLIKSGSDELRINFSPALPSGWALSGVAVNNVQTEAVVTHNNQVEIINLQFLLKDTCQVIIHGSGGVGVIPIILRPVPGDSSRGLRIINTRLMENTFIITIEGKSGTNGEFQIYLPDCKIQNIVNGRPLEKSGSLQTIGIDFEDTGDKYMTKEVVIGLDKY